MSKNEKKSITMTEGSIPRLLITFAIPLLLGNIFQQFYNMVDTWVVGNYVSNEAFSAVGTVGPIINMLIGFFMGLSSGAGVVISQFFGAQKDDKVQDTVHTAIAMTIILAVVITVAGLLLTRAAGFDEYAGGSLPDRMQKYLSDHLFCRCIRADVLQHRRFHSAGESVIPGVRSISLPRLRS